MIHQSHCGPNLVLKKEWKQASCGKVLAAAPVRGYGREENAVGIVWWTGWLTTVGDLGSRGFFGAQRPLKPNLGQMFIELCCVPGHEANSPPRPPIGRGFPVNQFTLPSPSKWGFPGGSYDKDCLQCRRPRFDPWFRKIPWRREWQPTLVFLPGKSHGQRNTVVFSPLPILE